jgi:thymidylate synthase
MGFIPDLYNSMHNESTLRSVLGALVYDIKRGKVVKSPDGDVTAELIGCVLKFNPYQKCMSFGDVKKTNLAYVQKELDWYISEKLNIHPMMDDVKVWNKVCGKNGEVCSNYGWAIYSNENGNQYEHCLNRLLENLHTKRGVMIYTRPSMWKDSKKNGMNDFMCTDGVQCQVVDNRLIYIVKQRSCDLIFGLFNDLAWHQHVYEDLIGDLRVKHPQLRAGVILYYPFNLHVYERHFDLVKQMYATFDEEEE